MVGGIEVGLAMRVSRGEMLQFVYGFYGSGLVASMGPYMVAANFIPQQ